MLVYLRRGWLLLAMVVMAPAQGAEFFLGGRLSQTSLDANDLVSGERTGRMVKKASILPAFTVTAFKHHFNGSPWGVAVEIGEESFWLDRQKLNDETEVEMGSKVIGYQWNVTPLFFYRFNHEAPKTAWKGRVGIGFGLGYLDIAGNIIMTDDPASPDVAIDSTSWTTSSGIFMELQKGDWIARLKSVGPEEEADGYKYRLSSSTLSIGRLFEF